MTRRSRAIQFKAAQKLPALSNVDAAEARDHGRHGRPAFLPIGPTASPDARAVARGGLLDAARYPKKR